MAIVANTLQTTAARGNRESLADVVTLVTQKICPLLTLIGKEKVTNTYHSWMTNAIRAPGANAQIEGDQFTFNAIAAKGRPGNHSQIMRESWIVSRSQNNTMNPGNVEQTKQARLDAGVALRKDRELSFLSNTASVGGTTRIAGGLPSWMTTNVSRGAVGANGGFSVGTSLTVAATNGTQRAFTKALMDTTLQSCFQNGANVNIVMMSPYVKSVFVTFMSDANVAQSWTTREAGNRKIVGDVSGYLGPNGDVDIINNPQMAASGVTPELVARNVFLLDSDMLAMGNYDELQDGKVTPNADAEAGVILEEATLIVKNQAGLGVIADVFGMSAVL